jgi:DNA-binding transcriptional LysR family regulator
MDAMRLRQIEVFRAVMLAGSVSEAARMLHVSQPVVSRVLRHAEAGLGFALFERSRGRLAPTPEAHALFAQVQRAWGEIERIDALSANLRRGASGLLRVAATPSLATSVLPAALAAMRAAHPGVECDLWASHTHEIAAHLLAYEVDVGIAIEPPAQVALTATPLACGEMVLVAPRAWVREVLRPGERGWLAGRPFVALAEATPLGERLAARLEQAGWRPQRALRVQTYALAGLLVEQGLGYAFVDGFTAASLAPERVVVLRLAPPIAFELHLLRNAGTPPSVLAGRLETCLRSAAATLTDALGARCLPETMALG